MQRGLGGSPHERLHQEGNGISVLAFNGRIVAKARMHPKKPAKMDKQRLRAYLKLIEQVLTCASGEEFKILESNRELVDAELLQVMAQVVEQLTAEGKQNSAEVLLGLRSELLDMLGISETPTSANPSSQDYLKFLTEVLLATDNSDSDPKVIYPLLGANLDKLDDNFIDILETWASAKLSEAEAEYIARVIWEFSHLIQQFPLGNKANNMEIAIAGYKQVLKVFTRESKRQSWAAIQTNLGQAYRTRIRGERALNLELAITQYQRALSVYTKSDFPIYWAMTQINLGQAYRNRIRHPRAENLEKAIARYLLALSVYTQSDFPYYWAEIQTHLAQAYSQRMLGGRAYNLELTIDAYQLALEVYTKEDFPIEWAQTQTNLGNAYSDRICGDRAENLEFAIEEYQLALEVYTQEDFPIEWAQTQSNLGIAYRNRIRGDRAKNLELAIEAFQQASSVRTKQELPMAWAMTQNNPQNNPQNNLGLPIVTESLVIGKRI
ncbi:tetratricopeptide repeat protein [Moorena producens]|uniref:tetratricopeptide repeat protein n=1 Tax=Moorena producens TaxID=1155739 RepID=UPI003C71E205